MIPEVDGSDSDMFLVDEERTTTSVGDVKVERSDERREEKEKSCPLVKECEWFRERSHVRSWVQMHSRREGLYMAKQGGI